MSSQAWATVPASAPRLLMPVSVIPMGAVAPSSPLLLPRPNPFSTEALSMGPIADLTPAFLRSHKAAFPDCSILRGLLSDGASSLSGSTGTSGHSGAVLSGGDNDAAIVANNIRVLYQESVNSTVALIGQNSFCVTPSDVDDIARLTREIEAVMRVISDCYTNEDRTALGNLCTRNYLSHISDTFYEIIVHLAHMLWVKSVQVIVKRVNKTC